jgi:hypothetical protein
MIRASGDALVRKAKQQKGTRTTRQACAASSCADVHLTLASCLPTSLSSCLPTCPHLTLASSVPHLTIVPLSVQDTLRPRRPILNAGANAAEGIPADSGGTGHAEGEQEGGELDGLCVVCLHQPAEVFVILGLWLQV